MLKISLLILMACVACSSASAGVSHSTYEGKIGGTETRAVLEFHDDGTVSGAYISSLMGTEPGNAVPLRRLSGRNPRPGVLEIDVSLNGAKIGHLNLSKADARDKFDRKVVGWTGRLTLPNLVVDVQWLKTGESAGQALISKMSDAAHRGFVNKPATLAYIMDMTKEHISDDSFGSLIEYFTPELVPMAIAPFPSRVMEEESHVVVRGRSLTEIDLGLEDGRGTVLPWNAERDGSFPLPPVGTGDKVHIFISKETGLVECIVFPGYFVDEKVRLTTDGKVELRGALWKAKYDREKDLEFADLEMGPGEETIIRPQWWAPGQQDLVWYRKYGYRLGSEGAGSGGIAMASLPSSKKVSSSPPPKTSNSRKAQPAQDPAFEWLDSSLMFSDSYTLESARGIHPVKKVPSFYIPWGIYYHGAG